ncbi:DUF1565 domain-containing protein, partial [bacterium]|nr:DUF1565 domain-containing protein [bacterium]
DADSALYALFADSAGAVDWSDISNIPSEYIESILFVMPTKPVTGVRDGSITNPFQTISQACAAAVPGDKIWVAAGTFNESFVVPARVSLYGNGIGKTVINGAITMSGGNQQLQDVTLQDVLILNGTSSLIDVHSYAPIVANGDLQGYNLTIWESTGSAPSLSVNSGQVSLVNGTIRSIVPGNLAVFQSGGQLVLSSVSVEGTNPGGPIIQSVGGFFTASTCYFLNFGGGPSADLNNGATPLTPNSLQNLFVLGDVTCGSAVTYTADYAGGNVTGSALLGYTNNGVHTFMDDIVLNAGLHDGFSLGNAGDALLSDGSQVYWGNVDSVNWADSAGYAVYADTANFVWRIPCDSVNACLDWDTLGFYYQSTDTVAYAWFAFQADSADWADNSGYALDAAHAADADSALYALFADSANYAALAGGIEGSLLLECGERIIGRDATCADSFIIYDDGDTTRFESDNPIKFGYNSLIVETGGDVIIDGNLGIGTDAPAQNLEVRGDALFGGGSTDYDGTDEFIQIQGQSEDWYIGVRNLATAGNSDFHIGLTQAQDGIFHIQPDGAVGIGTTSPNALLDLGGYGAPEMVQPTLLIADNVNGFAGVEMRNNSTGISADFRFAVFSPNDDYLAFSMPGDNNNALLFGQTRNTTAYIFTNTLGGGGPRNLGIGTFQESDLILATHDIERLRIQADGDVGIGTSTPGAALAVNGGVHIGGDSDPGDNNLLVDGDISIGELFALQQTTQTALAANATLTPGSSHILIAGAAGPVTLGSAGVSAAIADGSYTGQILILVGNSDANFVSIRDQNNQPASNVELDNNNDITIRNNETLMLMWNGSDWVMIAYSAN